MFMQTCRGLRVEADVLAFLGEAGFSRDSAIHVTGPGSLAALLWLHHHGFDRVGYVRAGAAAPHESCDLLLRAPSCDELSLKQLLPAARQVRCGGALIFQLDDPAMLSCKGVAWLLASVGLDLEQWLPGRHRVLCLARRRRIVGTLKAAS